jgi:hypothetical protein
MLYLLFIKVFDISNFDFLFSSFWFQYFYLVLIAYKIKIEHILKIYCPDYKIYNINQDFNVWITRFWNNDDHRLSKINFQVCSKFWSLKNHDKWIEKKVMKKKYGMYVDCLSSPFNGSKDERHVFCILQ